MNVSDNYQELHLSLNDAVNSSLFVDPLDRDLGSDIEFESISLRIGRRPSAKNLASYYEATGQEVPDKYSLYVSYNIYLISLTVGLMNTGSWKKVKQFGFQLEYENQPKVTILELLPQTEFVQIVGGEFESHTDLSLSGTASIPDSLISTSDNTELLSYGAEIKTSNKANIAAKLTLNVLTPKVIATGVGDHIAHWLFKKDNKRLVGDQTLVHSLLVPLNVSELKFKARLYATVNGFGTVPVKLISDWVDMGLELD